LVAGTPEYIYAVRKGEHVDAAVKAYDEIDGSTDNHGLYRVRCWITDDLTDATKGKYFDKCFGDGPVRANVSFTTASERKILYAKYGTSCVPTPVGDFWYWATRSDVQDATAAGVIAKFDADDLSGTSCSDTDTLTEDKVYYMRIRVEDHSGNHAESTSKIVVDGKHPLPPA
jgi:hypothetical protein